MKKLIVILFLFFAIVSNAQMFKVFGQEIGFVYAGPKIGGVFSKISNFDEPAFPGAAQPDVKFRTGFQFGIVGKLSITPKLSIQPEITFLQKGLKTEVSGATSKYKTGYIGIPVIAKYALTQFGNIKIHVEGGAFSNIRTSGKYEFTDVTGQTTEGELNNDGWRRMDYGFVIGGGFEYEIDKGIIVFDLRYDQSFMDVHISDATFNSNRSIGFSVAYLFDFVDIYKGMKEKKKTTN